MIKKSIFKVAMRKALLKGPTKIRINILFVVVLIASSKGIVTLYLYIRAMLYCLWLLMSQQSCCGLHDKKSRTYFMIKRFDCMSINQLGKEKNRMLKFCSR